MWKDGRSMFRKYGGVIPPELFKHLRSVSVADVASSREEIALLDARTSELLETLENKDMASVSSRLVDVASLLRRMATSKKNAKVSGETLQAVLLERVNELDAALTDVMSANATWDEIRRNLDSRTKTVSTEIRYQQMLSDRIMVEQLDAFVRALIVHARELTDDPKKLMLYTERVMISSRAVLGDAIEPRYRRVDDEKGEEG